MRTNCPSCGFGFDASGGSAGRRSVCPRCRQSFDAFAAGDTVDLGAAAPAGTASRVGPHSPVGSAVGRQFEEYRIIDEVGRGAMGVVYKAIQETLDRPVALKMIAAGEAARGKEIKRFLREAAAVARLRHPNIVTIYELDVHEGIYYFTMDYVEGRSLRELVGEGGTEPREAARIAEKVARALEHAHRRGIVHRDLKPANVIVEPSGEPVITDFGLAFDVRRAEDPDGEAAGTPLYMAPEQVLGLPAAAGPACDIYSLGAVLYELLTGRAPFEAGTVREILEAVARAEPRSPRRLRSGLDPALCAIVMKCLAKAPEERYSSAEELADALAQWLEASG